MQKTNNWKERILLFLKPPGWRPESLGSSVYAEEVDRNRYIKYDPIVSKQRMVLGFLEFLVLTVFSLLLLKYFKSGIFELWKIFPVIVFFFYGFRLTGFVLDGYTIGKARIILFLLVGMILYWILFFV